MVADTSTVGSITNSCVICVCECETLCSLQTTLKVANMAIKVKKVAILRIPLCRWYKSGSFTASKFEVKLLYPLHSVLSTTM